MPNYPYDEIGTQIDRAFVQGINKNFDEVEQDINGVIEPMQAMIEETTNRDIISAPEIIAARDGSANLGDRLALEHKEVTSQLLEKATQTQLKTEKERIDNLIAVEGTTDNAETADIRIGADGITRSLAGDSVRHFSKKALNHDDIFISGDGIVGEIKPYEAINTNFDISDSNLINNVAAAGQLFSNGTVLRDNVRIKGVTINAINCSYIQIGVARGLGTTGAKWVKYLSNAPVTNSYVDFSTVNGDFRETIFKAGDVVFVGFNSPSAAIKYSADTYAVTKALISSATFNTINVKYLTGFNVDYETLTFEFKSPKRLPAAHYLLAIGDSIEKGETNNNVSSSDYAAEYLGINLIKEGHSGYSMGALYNLLSGYSMMATVITVKAGTNDFNAGVDLSAFRVIVRNMIEGLRTRYPGKPIIFFTPIQRNYPANTSGIVAGLGPNSKGLYLIDYVNVIIELCAEYGVDCVDLYRKSGVSAFDIEVHTNDGVHLNDLGQKLVGSICVDELLRYLSI